MIATDATRRAFPQQEDAKDRMSLILRVGDLSTVRRR